MRRLLELILNGAAPKILWHLPLFLLLSVCVAHCAVVIKPTTTLSKQMADQTRGAKILHCSKDFFGNPDAAPLTVTVDNCLKMTAAMDGRTLRFSPILLSSDASEFSVDHYTVFISTDGQRLMPLIDLAPFTHSFDLTLWVLPSGRYTFYVKAVGKPFITNRLSNPARFLVK